MKRKPQSEENDNNNEDHQPQKRAKSTEGYEAVFGSYMEVSDLKDFFSERMLQYYGRKLLNKTEIQDLESEKKEEQYSKNWSEQELNLGVRHAFWSVQILWPDDDDVDVEVGDFIKVDTDQPHDQVAQVDVIFEDHKGQFYIKVWWYYVDFDTPLRVPLNNEDLKDVAKGLRVGNGDNCKMPHPDVYWVDQQTSLQHWNFEQLPGTEDQQKEYLKLHNRDKPKKKQLLRMLDIYSGCGGMAYICEASDKEVEIRHSWACDFKESMAYAVKSNFPQTRCFAMKVEELVAYSKWLNNVKFQIKQLGWDLRDLKEVEDQELPNLIGVLDVKIKPKRNKGLKLDFYVGSLITGIGEWYPAEQILEEHPEIFVTWLERQTDIPVPGNVDLVIGGPPCQGISGLNRHAKVEDILNDERNSQVKTYSQSVIWFKPRYCLMEQVQNIVSKEHGLYLKFAQVVLKLLRYQSRVGVCYAGHYGCPQTRVRVFLWGAAPGEHLPPYPAPIHRVAKELATFTECDQLFVDVPKEAKPNLLPALRLGDILFDIPILNNYTHGEIQQRKELDSWSSPFQLWLRRKPTHPKIIEDRSKLSGWPSQKILERALKDPKLLLKIGKIFACRKKLNGGSHAAKTLSVYLRQNLSMINNNKQYFTSFRARGIIDTGRSIIKEMIRGRQTHTNYSQQLATQDSQLQDWITDCMPLRCNNDDYWRMAGLPIASGVSFRNLPGVYNDPMKGMCCAGHHHAYRFLLEDKEVKKAKSQLGTKYVFPNPGNAVLKGGMTVEEYNSVERTQSALDLGIIKEIKNGNNSARKSKGKNNTKRSRGRLAKPLINNSSNTTVSAKPEASTSSSSKTFKQNLAEVGKLVYCVCPAGGHMLKPKSCKTKEGRVDTNTKNMPGLYQLKGCPAQTIFLPSLDLLVPRWCITYKQGKNGRYIPNPSKDIFQYDNVSKNVCFGRLWFSDVMATVVTRAEPHNLQVVHPTQARVMSVRELARCQGFPDHHVMAHYGMQYQNRQGTQRVRGEYQTDRYLQVGNAVAPLQAAYLGECLIMAAKKQTKPEEYVVRVRHDGYEDLLEEGLANGMLFWENRRERHLQQKGVGQSEQASKVDVDEDVQEMECDN
eukprot:TRINITY_DN8458_c0_g2_i3.p1 TRINITY_DN8458_c0_g2~~TRINITY_DN8458_c0_g2_i3.p1  ORF type:complete len:1127 (+),score=134.82 TRINITY_DN8458_c0_g2_i3:54-3383(+)